MNLLEGRQTLFFVAVDKNTGEYEHVGAFNILQGALIPDQILFSNKEGYRTFENIETFDLDFSSEFDSILKLFKSYPLAFILKHPQKDISNLCDFPF